MRVVASESMRCTSALREAAWPRPPRPAACPTPAKRNAGSAQPGQRGGHRAGCPADVAAQALVAAVIGAATRCTGRSVATYAAARDRSARSQSRGGSGTASSARRARAAAGSASSRSRENTLARPVRSASTRMSTTRTAGMLRWSDALAAARPARTCPGAALYQRLQRRRGRAQHHGAALHAPAHHRHVARVVARAPPPACSSARAPRPRRSAPGPHRREHRRARPDDDVAPARRGSRCHSSCRSPSDRWLCSTATRVAEPRHGTARRSAASARSPAPARWRPCPAASDVLDGLQVDLRLAAAGHAVQQDHRRVAACRAARITSPAPPPAPASAGAGGSESRRARRTGPARPSAARSSRTPAPRDFAP